MQSFRAHPGVAHLALSMFAALGGCYILVYGSWKAVTAESALSVFVALLGAVVAVRNAVQLIAGRAVVTVSGNGVELKGLLSRPVRRALDDCSAMKSTSFMLMPAIELAHDPSLDDNRPRPEAPATDRPRIRLLRVGFDFAAIADAIDRHRTEATRE